MGALSEACGSARDHLIVETMWQTGGRVSELLSLTPPTIDLAGEVLRTPTLKRRARVAAGGVHVRTIPLGRSSSGSWPATSPSTGSLPRAGSSA